ncbi:hypothetical protein BT93_G0740 [Corymbia citriodora subsp. variegata]|nr:hypothetical protein BT93_G0740 [Corymbia citriodora subsp. variegata]
MMASYQPKKDAKEVRESRLQQAIANDDVNELHDLIGEERELLDRVCKHPFPDTPLHIAAAAGKIEVAMEMAILRPSFAQTLNPEGYSPMHLALQYEHYHTVRALMTLDPELIRVKGRGGITPLHYVAMKEGDKELELLAKFLCISKSSIEDLTSRCESAVHVAVKYHNFKAFEVLLGWLKRVNLTEILGWQDKDGNTALHIAVFEAQPQIIKLLIGYPHVFAKNFQDQTALEIFQANPSGGEDVAKMLQREERRKRSLTPTLSLPQFFSEEPTVLETLARLLRIENEDFRNVILVVSTLIATATYQAALSPPGGFWQDSSSNPQANSTVATANSSSIANGKPHQAGTIILNRPGMYLFTIFNATAFLASIGAIWATITPLLLVVPHTIMVHVALALLSLTYFFSLLMELPNSSKLAVFLPVEFYAVSLNSIFVFAIYSWKKHRKAVPRIDAPGRRIGNLL